MKNKGRTIRNCGGQFGLSKYQIKSRIWGGGHAVTRCQQKIIWCGELSSKARHVIAANRYLNQLSMLYGLAASWMGFGKMKHLDKAEEETLLWILRGCSHGSLQMTITWSCS